MRLGIFVFTLTLAFVFLNIINVYGAEWGTAESEIRPLYVETATYFVDFNIDANGNAEIKGTLEPLKSSATDKVCAVVKITNVMTRKVVYNQTIKMTYSKPKKNYILDESYQLIEKGKYQMDLTYKCYTGNMLLESIQTEPKVKTYA